MNINTMLWNRMEVRIEVVKQLVRVNVSWENSTRKIWFKDSWNISSFILTKT